MSFYFNENFQVQYFKIQGRLFVGNKLKVPPKNPHFTPKNKKRYPQLKLPPNKLFGTPKKRPITPKLIKNLPPNKSRTTPKKTTFLPPNKS